jgi:uncharacterized protein (TIGR03083 family)
MMNIRDYRHALVREVELIRQMIGDADEESLGRSSPCSGWSVLDVARHVEVTPRTVADHLIAHARGDPAPQIEPVASTVGRQDVLVSLDIGYRRLNEALSQLSDEALDGELPGPLGPMPGRAALDLALTELTLHRCDIALGIGIPAEIDPTAAVAIVDVIQAWLLLVAPASPTPEEPLCYLLSDGSHKWSFGFDGTRWTIDPCTGYGRTVTAQGTSEQLALALAGRRPIQQAVDESSDPAAIAKLKTYLPGP